MNLRLAAVWSGSSGGGRKLGGKIEAVPLTSSLSMRRGGLKAQLLGQLQLLEDEAGEALRVGRRQQDAVGAGGLQIAVGPLHADGAAQHAQRRPDGQMLRLHARFVLLVWRKVEPMTVTGSESTSSCL